MHEEIKQWEIHPKFPLNPVVSIVIGVLTGLAFGYMIQNLVLGAILGLVAGAATALALSRASRDESGGSGNKLHLWALVPLLGFVASTVILWVFQFCCL